MELRQLRYFMAVADELHFGRAAQRLHMSQPPLSVQIGRLEREVGMSLFDRSTRRVELTPAGRHLQERARRILDEVDSMRAEMRDYAEGLMGQFVIGFTAPTTAAILQDAVDLFRSARENVSLTLVRLSPHEQFERLRGGGIDVGIVQDDRGTGTNGWATHPAPASFTVVPVGISPATRLLVARPARENPMTDTFIGCLRDVVSTGHPAVGATIAVAR